MIESYEDWSGEDLWEHAQANFAGHLAMMFTYLQSRNLEPREFITYTGAQAAPGWSECESAADMMNAVLLNVLANGGIVTRAEIGTDRAEALVSRLVNLEVMTAYGVRRELSDSLWDKFHPIAQSLGLRFNWEREEEGYRISVLRPPA